MRKIKIMTWMIFLFMSFTLVPFCPTHEAKNESASAILQKENIDVVIKYIDLTDDHLKREGIPQIKKDSDNSELKYAVRSVLKNIPWVRKIFIVMPNEKVRYFKDPELISDKIVYIKDKDLLGFDSASISSFQFHFWKLKDFGVSKNFIYMDDDYFIGKPLKKSDFFYVDKGKVVPYVLYTRNVGRGHYEELCSYYKNLKDEIKFSHPHSHAGFQYQKTAGIMFLSKIFGENMIVPNGEQGYFPHNALGENWEELKEVYDLVNQHYERADDCLRAKTRNNNAFVHQTVYNFYVLNKYKRKINKLEGAYIDLSSALYTNFDYPLFCINTGGNKAYNEGDYSRARVGMNKLFPHPTPYEIPEIKSGVYTLVSGIDSNKVLDISNASYKEGANLQIWSKNNTTAQKFKFFYQSDGSYTIRPMCSYKRLDVARAGKTPGTNIWQHNQNSTAAQRWYVIPCEKGYYNLVSKCNDLCMDIDNAKNQNGANVHCWEPNGTAAQKFKFVKVD